MGKVQDGPKRNDSLIGGIKKMPLIAHCMKCGKVIEVKKLTGGKRVFVIEYECPSCKLTIREMIPWEDW